MAEIVLSSFADIVLGKLDNLITEEVQLLVGVEDEFEKLKHSMTYIQAIISDAEKQYDTSATAKIWLEDLEDFLFEMDDLLDDIDIKNTIQQKIKGVLLKKVKKFFSGSNFLLRRHRFAHQVRGLSEKLEAIRSNGRDFKHSPYQAGAISISSESRETFSKLPSWDTLGRDEDKHNIISFVSGSFNCENVTVIPIVGIGGLGKTTLAQLIYEDETINDNFNHKVWVFVSKNFSLLKILRQVIRSTSGEMTNMDHLSLEDLQLKVQDILLGKKYFVVLDDVWNENPIELRKVRGLLNVGARGSCILVTTRSAEVALHISTIPYYRLQGLSRAIGLLLFKRLAFGVGDEHCNREKSLFDEMAEDIVDKSGGMPLILVVLGNLLAGNRDESKWNHTIQKLKNGHEDILAILKLSYDELPPFLKPCFRIMSIFCREKNYIHVEYLTYVWISLGFISSNDHEQSLEEMTMMYIKELWSKSLLYDATYYCGDVIYFVKMHDCLKDLARSISSEMVVVNCNVRRIDKRVKYIVFDDDSSPQSLPQGICTASKARLFKLQTTKLVQKSFLEDIIVRFKWLRVLDLSENNFEELPSSIGSMKHLRMLNLAGNRMIEAVPNTICKLLNLQSLLFNHCMQLQHLPNGTGRLQRLRYLSVTTQQEDLPEEIGSLTELRFLWLSHCSKLASLPRSLKSLNNLEELYIDRCERIDLLSNASVEALQGINELHTVEVCAIPSFVGFQRDFSSLAGTLYSLIMYGNKQLRDLSPWIVQFTHLKRLQIESCPGLLSLPAELRILDYLEILDCPDLKSWLKRDDSGLISHIEEVVIDDKLILSEADI